MEELETLIANGKLNNRVLATSRMIGQEFFVTQPTEQLSFNMSLPSCDGLSPFIAAAISWAAAPASARAGFARVCRGRGSGASRRRRMGGRMRRKEQSRGDRDQMGHGGDGSRPPQWTSRRPSRRPARPAGLRHCVFRIL